MKNLLISLCAIVYSSLCFAVGITVVPGNVKVERAGSNLAVGMTLDLSGLPIKSNMSLTITPVLSSEGNERLELPSVTVAGRSRYHTLKRERDPKVSEFTFRQYSKDMSPMEYAALVPYAEWMGDAELSIETNTEGCCSRDLGMSVISVKTLNLNPPAKFTAEYAYISPVAEAVKVREIEGKAYVDFKVNRTDILPDYGHNPDELAKIRESIDAIRNNSDTKIRSLSITGYASPEGSYSNNERLARGRTIAVADYVSSLYKFPEGIVHTGWIAEDWAGVRRFLQDNPSFDHCDDLLTIVDSDASPDDKDTKIKTKYPMAYRYMLENVYPSLRHTDYIVEYEVRSYSSPKEIAEVFRSHPGDLSLQEMFVLAKSYPEGSEEYSEVFITAARLFPDSEVAAVNAAFAEMERENYTGSAQYLSKGGESPEAIYARGLLSAFTGDYVKARQLLKKAKSLGVIQAESALTNLSMLSHED